MQLKETLSNVLVKGATMTVNFSRARRDLYFHQMERLTPRSRKDDKNH